MGDYFQSQPAHPSKEPDMPLVPTPQEATIRGAQRANRDAWVAALRSGKYAQGGGALKRGDSYCCLGVACELFRQALADDPHATLTADWDKTSGFVVRRMDDHSLVDSNRLSLPYPVLNWLGLADSSGRFNERDDTKQYGHTYLADLNDRGTSFDVIADIIAREPDGLIA